MRSISGRTILNYLLSFALILILACNDDTSVDSTSEQTPFFDLRAFFSEEKAKHQKIQSFNKTVVLNGKEEIKQLDSLDLNTELSLFVESDINKTAWLDKYSVDSLIDNGQLRQIRYTAIEDKLNTRLLKVDYTRGQVDSILIKNESSSVVAKSEEWLTYFPNKGYRIQHIQQVTSQPEHALTVDVKFVY